MLQRQAIRFAAGRLDSQFCIFFFVFFYPGTFGRHPGNPEHHRDQPASADCTGGLSQPAHGEGGREGGRSGAGGGGAVLLSELAAIS